jgi:hypothetical protein
MGKYDAVIDNLPTLQAEEPNYQLKVEAKKREIFGEIGDALSSGSVAQLYKNARLEKEDLEEQLYDTNLELTAITQMLIDRYEIDGISSLKLDSGEKVSIQYEPYAVVEDRAKVWEWCKENGYEREMQLNWATLNAVTKDRLLQGLSEPEGVRAYVKIKPIFSRG